jgi:sugar/nucleoside kinase (ribokinase family)
MPRTLTIVAAGEALLDETGEKPAPGGLAMSAAIQAVRLGHVGVVVSRVGQDAAAHALLDCVQTLGVNVEHVQSDPDLPTGKRWSKRFGAASQMDTRAAFDNLQWDHDLVDLAMRAHVIIAGALARRSGQTRAEIDRFVSEARTALKVFDLVNRDDEHFERREQLAMLNLVDSAVIDRHAANVLVPAKRSAPLAEAAREVLREFKLEFAIVLAEGAASVEIITKDSAAQHELPSGADAQHESLVVALAHFMAHGCDLNTCVERSAKIVQHALQQPTERVPESMLTLK